MNPPLGFSSQTKAPKDQLEDPIVSQSIIRVSLHDEHMKGHVIFPKLDPPTNPSFVSPKLWIYDDYLISGTWMNDAYEWSMNVYRWFISQGLNDKMKRVGHILGYDSCPYLINLNLNGWIARAFRIFKVWVD